MSDPTIFGNNQNPDTNPNNGGSNPPNQPQVDQALVTMLASIKNEAGEQKYKTVQEALNALAHSQAYIPQLKQELDATKVQLAQATQAASKVEQLELTVQQLAQNNLNRNDQPNGISEEKIAELVQSQLTLVQQKQVQKANIDSVASRMKEVFGDKAEEMFYGKAQELGMSREQINNLAATTPKAVLNLLGVSVVPSQNRGTPNSNSINTAAFQPSQDSAIVKNSKSVLMGASTDEIRNERINSNKLVEELHAQGKSTYDLTDPKVYKQYFG